VRLVHDASHDLAVLYQRVTGIWFPLW